VSDLGKYVTIAPGEDSCESGYVITTCQKPDQRAAFSMAKPILEIFFITDSCTYCIFTFIDHRNKIVLDKYKSKT